MRRLLATIVVPSLALAACGSDDDDGSADTTPASLVETAPDTEAPPETEARVETDATPETEPPDTEAPPETNAPPETDAPPETAAAPATDAPATTAEEIAEPALALFSLVDRGEYAVGVTTVIVDDTTRERPLTVDVWFPLAEGSATDAPLHRYTFVTGDYFESAFAVSAGPESMAGDGPFPLVVYSHGSGGTRYIHSDYTETIASHGHVVVAPDHTGNTAVERVTGEEVDRDRIALDRPLDVSVVIDALTDPSHPTAGVFAGVVDPDRVAVTGHSFGGYTAYAVVSGYENGLGSVPADDRVDAIIPLAPAVGDGGDQTLLTDDDLARVDVPALVMVGSDDVTTPVDPNVERAWEFTASVPHYRAELVAAEHQSFTDLCDYLVAFETNDPPPTDIVVQTIEPLAAEGCSPDDMPAERVQEITNTLAIAFLDSVFEGEEMITPETTAIPDDLAYQVKS